jgi:hypothetical protein
MCSGGRSGRYTTAQARKSDIPKRTKRGTGTFAMDIAQCPDGVNKPTGSFVGADFIFYVRFCGVEVERGTFHNFNKWPTSRGPRRFPKVSLYWPLIWANEPFVRNQFT